MPGSGGTHYWSFKALAAGTTTIVFNNFYRSNTPKDQSPVLARAFQDDPAWGWVLPNPRRRAALLPWLFQTGFEIADAQVWTTEGEIHGVARWLPPGRPNVLRRGGLDWDLVDGELRVIRGYGWDLRRSCRPGSC